jgi:seryl-tRNA synthetase
VKKAGGNVQEIFAKVRDLAAQNKDKEVKLAQVEKDMQALVEVLPNMPDPDLVGGGKENNHPIYHFGKEPTFDGFKPKDHVELEESLGLIDYKRGVKISSSGTGCTPVSAPSWSGLCSITSSLSTLPMAIPLFFRRTC